MYFFFLSCSLSTPYYIAPTCPRSAFVPHLSQTIFSTLWCSFLPPYYIAPHILPPPHLNILLPLKKKKEPICFCPPIAPLIFFLWCSFSTPISHCPHLPPSPPPLHPNLNILMPPLNLKPMRLFHNVCTKLVHLSKSNHIGLPRAVPPTSCAKVILGRVNHGGWSPSPAMDLKIPSAKRCLAFLHVCHSCQNEQTSNLVLILSVFSLLYSLALWEMKGHPLSIYIRVFLEWIRDKNGTFLMHLQGSKYQRLFPSFPWGLCKISYDDYFRRLVWISFADWSLSNSSSEKRTKQHHCIFFLSLQRESGH